MSKKILIIGICITFQLHAKYNPLPPDIDGGTNTNPIASSNQELYCDSPPTKKDVLDGQFRTRKIIVSRIKSGELGFKELFTGSSSNNHHAYILESYRSKSCLAIDGETTLEYGFAIRIGVSSNSKEHTGGITLPFLAASATISNSYSSVEAIRIGYNDPDLDAAIVTAGASPLNVETFSNVNENIKNAAKIASKIRDLNKLNVNLLGWLSPDPEDYLISDVKSVNALKLLAKGKSCIYSEEKLNNQLSEEVEKVYQTITEIDSCDNTKPTTKFKNKAKSILNN